MITPQGMFAAVGAVALTLGVGFQTTQGLFAPSRVTQNVLANRPDPPPPTVEKVERKKPVVATAEHIASPSASPTEGSAGASGGLSVREALAPVTTAPVPVATPPKLATASLQPSVPFGEVPAINVEPAAKAGKPKKRERAVQVWDGDSMREVIVEREEGCSRRERRRGRIEGDDYRPGSRRVVGIDEPRRRREVFIEAPRYRGGDFFPFFGLF